MALELTWDCTYNVTPTDQTSLTAQCRSFMKQLKDYLVATAGWTVTESCDSTQVLSSDTWAALANIVAASSGAHSWLVLKSPEGIVAGLDGTYTGNQSRLWLCFDMNNNNYYQFTAKIHLAAPTGGTTSAAPASVAGNTITLGGGSMQFNRSTLNASGNFHFASAQNGKFLAMLSYLGVGYVPFAMGCLPISDVSVIASSGKDYPYGTAFFGGFSDSGTGIMAWSMIYNTVYCWTYDGTSVSGRPNAFCDFSGLVGSGFSASGDSLNGKHLTSPVWLSCVGSGRQCLIGRVPDFFLSGVPTPQAAVDAASPTLTKVGSFWVPTDAILTI